MARHPGAEAIYEVADLFKVARDDLTPLAYTDDGGPAPARRALPGSARGAGGEFRASPLCGSREEGDSFSEI